MKCDYQICIKFQIDLSHTTKEIKDDSGDKSTRLTSSRLQVQTPGPHTHTKKKKTPEWGPVSENKNK
jgi:hypothetical protein